MSMKQDQSAERSFSLQSVARPECSTCAPLTDVTTKAELGELERLLQGIVSAPAELMDGAVIAAVRKAMKARSRLSVLLALRALRLEQRLRQAQRQLIQLQWELAQFRRCEAPPPACRPEVED